MHHLLPRTVRFALALFTLAALLTVGAPGPLGAQSNGQASRDAQVDRLFERWDRADSPGCALGVIQDGELIYTRGYGSANLDYEVPLDSRSVFYMASVSKQFTAAAVALAARQGHFSLDDDIRTYFPELPDYGATITVRHLVHHTSGLRDYLQLMTLAGMNRADVHSDQAILDLIARQKELNFQSGEEYLYSNSGYFLMAELIERTTGRSFRDYTAEEIFQPLGMHDTHFHTDPGHVQKRRAIGYSSSRDQGFRIAFLANFDKVGSGGLYSTVEDMLLWDRNFEESRIGGPDFIDQLVTPGVLHDGQTMDYAFGLRLAEYRGQRTVSHGGTMMGYKTAFLRFPDERFSVVCLCNLSNIDPTALAHDVADIYLADRLAPREPAVAERDDAVEAAVELARLAAPAPSPAELEAYAGSYYGEELDATYTVTVRDDGVRLRLANGTVRRAEPIEPDVFEAGAYELHFVRDGAGKITGFRLMAGRVRNLEFVRFDSLNR